MSYVNYMHQFSSVTESCPTPRPHGLQHPRPLCRSLTLGVYSNSCPSHRWCYPTISSSVIPFFCLQSFPAPESSNESALRIRWPNDWSFSFSISPSNEHPGLISFRMDWLDLLVVEGTLKILLQHHSSKASILQCSAFFTVKITSIHDYWKYLSLDLCWQSNVSAF